MSQDPRLEIKRLEKELLVHEVDRILLQVVRETAEKAFAGQCPDTTPYARKIVAFLREHLVD